MIYEGANLHRKEVQEFTISFDGVAGHVRGPDLWTVNELPGSRSRLRVVDHDFVPGPCYRRIVPVRDYADIAIGGFADGQLCVFCNNAAEVRFGGLTIWPPRLQYRYRLAYALVILPVIDAGDGPRFGRAAWTQSSGALFAASWAIPDDAARERLASPVKPTDSQPKHCSSLRVLPDSLNWARTQCCLPGLRLLPPAPDVEDAASPGRRWRCSGYCWCVRRAVPLEGPLELAGGAKAGHNSATAPRPYDAAAPYCCFVMSSQ